MSRQRKDIIIDFRYPDPDLPSHGAKPEADIQGWMEKEGFTKERLLVEGGLLREWYKSQRIDPYFFILEEILDGKPYPPTYRNNGEFIKKEERRVSYFSYRTNRMAWERCLWYQIQQDFPEQTKGYWQGYVQRERVDIDLWDIVPGALYWVKSGEWIIPVRFIHWDEVRRAWIGKAEDVRGNSRIILKDVDRIRPPLPPSSSDTSPQGR